MATKTEERVDVSQYINRVDVCADWRKQEADMLLKMQQLDKRQLNAEEILASPDSLMPEKRAADVVLAECKVRRGKIEAGLDRARRAITGLRDEIARMQPEYDRQQSRIKRAKDLH